MEIDLFEIEEYHFIPHGGSDEALEDAGREPLDVPPGDIAWRTPPFVA